MADGYGVDAGQVQQAANQFRTEGEAIGQLAGRVEHPTVSSLTDPAFDTFGVRVAFILGWLGAGWHLVR